MWSCQILENFQNKEGIIDGRYIIAPICNPDGDLVFRLLVAMGLGTLVTVIASGKN
jgi:hypothetical protein